MLIMDNDEDLYKAMAAFLMCFGQGLPVALKQQIRDHAYALADDIERGGEPTVAKMARGFADALVTEPPMH